MVTLADVQDAHTRIASYVRRNDTIQSHTLSQRLNTNVYLKLELFQKAGSFKRRAAFNKMLHLRPEERERGVVAVSGGNFAQSVAYAGRALDVRTTIFMPTYTPHNYIAATRSYGAQVELVPDIQSAFDAAEQYQSSGMIFMHPYDDVAVMAGNGTLGLEVVEDVPQVTDVIVSVGGGGLMAGTTVAIKGVKPETRIWSVETEGADALARALEAQRVVRIQPSSLARTLGAPYIAADALLIAQQHIQQHILVSDREAYQAQRFLLERTKVLTELAASCTLAAANILQANFSPEDHVVLILCGGNVSLDELLLYKSQFE
jgi:threonine dehydratase